jgi:putative Holliday junction resolvase
MQKKNRILGIDPGTKRVGLAVSDELGITAQGIETYEISSKHGLNDYLGELIRVYTVGHVIVGLPLSMSGGDIEGSERARELAERIRKHHGVPVTLRDERMTSLEAERILRQEGRIRNAGDIDRLAAVLLLQSYLDETNDR